MQPDHVSTQPHSSASKNKWKRKKGKPKKETRDEIGNRKKTVKVFKKNMAIFSFC